MRTLLLLCCIRVVYGWSPCAVATVKALCFEKSLQTSHSRRCRPLHVGPNADQRPEFFADAKVLEAEIREYLAERAAGPPQAKDSQNNRSNPILNFLSVDAAKLARLDQYNEGYEEPEEWEGSPDPLEYNELRAYGYTYLVEPIMNAGGYVVVSNALDIPVSPVKRKKQQGFDDALLQPSQPTRGFLALGGSLDERIQEAAANAPSRAAQRTALFERQAQMDPEEREARRQLRDAPPPVYTRSPGSAARAAAKAAEAEAAAAAPPAERIGLSALQRGYTVAVAAATALGYGHASQEAVTHGLPQSAVEAAAAVSLALLLANVASTALSARLAAERGRSVPLWGLKAALSGPVCVGELRSLGAMQTTAD